MDGGHDPTRRYIRETMATEVLDAETERMLALAWRDQRDEAALQRLIGAYARLAVSMAGRYRRHDVPFEDLVQQGNLGLMRAAEKFDPDNGARFSTYARWWIKASMQDFVMRNLSMVRLASTAAQRKLFFNLRRAQASIERLAEGRGERLDPEALQAQIATALEVSTDDVAQMMARLSGPDLSLNAPQGEAEESREWIDLLEDDAPLTEDAVLGARETAHRRHALADALLSLPLRERKIVVERHLQDEPRTLTDLGADLGISKERVRQLEERALSRMRERVSAGAAAAAVVHAGA